MSFKDLRLPEETIVTSGGSFTVRGLSLPDVAQLVRHHRSVVEKLFDNVKSEGTDLGVAQLAAHLLNGAPEFAAEVVALGAGEGDDESVQKARRLPFTVQLAALEKIGACTFAMEGGIRNFLETVIRMAESASAVMEVLNSPQSPSSSTTGSEGSTSE